MEIKPNYHVNILQSPLTSGNLFGIRPASFSETFLATVGLLAISLVPAVLFGEDIGWSALVFYLFLNIFTTDLKTQVQLLFSATKKMNLLNPKTYYLMLTEIFIAIWIFGGYATLSLPLAISFLVFWVISGLAAVLLYTKNFLINSTEKEFLEICRVYGLSRTSFMWATIVIGVTRIGHLGLLLYAFLFALTWVWLSNSLPYTLKRSELLQMKKVISFVDKRGETTINSIQTEFAFSEERVSKIVGSLYALTIMGIKVKPNQDFKKIREFNEYRLLKVSISDMLLI
ncbi:hypothetical protein HY990_05775 [Candidatus Micrarchaeota archaeon]|nr:hypothetical protein [Candidatus Micrarchaeota archaeon]